MAPVKPEEAGHPSGALQSRHVYIQVHAVDALDFQRHMFRQNLRHTA